MEEVCSGRLGATLVKFFGENGRQWGLVRTTTKYKLPVLEMTKAHEDVIKEIQTIDPSLCFNNILVEIYDNTYTKMGFHTDQMQDLANDSSICIFSMYTCGHTPAAPRVLVVKNKITGEEQRIILQHNMIVVFSLETNRNYTHKIVLEERSSNTNEWFGMTFRQSACLVHHIDDDVFFSDGKTNLTLATPDEAKLFYKYRQQENTTINFKWPALTFTINPGDLLHFVRLSPLPANVCVSPLSESSKS